MTTERGEPHRPLLGEPNAPCRACGAPLVADQRYCLQCGERRAEARLPFLDILAGRAPIARGEVVAETVTTARRGPGGWVARMGNNAAAVAGVGCLLLALGVGVLIGGIGDGGGPSAAAPPQVISVGGVAPAAAATTATPAAADAGARAGRSSKKTKKAKGSSSDASSSEPAAKTKATNKALQELDSSSPEDYQKKAAKLPKTLGTGGEAPPKDDKPAAGGGAFEEIG